MVDEIKHYGVVGMKWGVRKDAARADKKWAKKLSTGRPIVDAYNAAAENMNNGRMADFNNQPKFKGVNMLEEGPIQTQYYDSYSKMFTQELNRSLADHGVSPTGAYQVQLEWHAMEDTLPRWSITETKVKHSEFTDIDVVVSYTPKGFVKKIEFKPKSAIIHSDDVPLADDSIGNLRMSVLDYDPDAHDSMAFGADILDSFFYED